MFELLTAVFAGDADHYLKTGKDFRLNDDWKSTQEKWVSHPVLAAVENTDFLQAITMLVTLKRNMADTSDRPPAISAKREDAPTSEDSRLRERFTRHPRRRNSQCRQTHRLLSLIHI